MWDLFQGMLLSLKYRENEEEVYLMVWVYTLSLLPELGRLKGKSVNIITYEPYNQIAELYKSYCKKIITLPWRRINQLKIYAQSGILYRGSYLGGKWSWDDNSAYLDVPNVYVPGLFYNIKDLKIPYKTKHALISDPISMNEEGFLDLIKKNNVPEGKAVLLIPYAQSAKQLEDCYWERIAKLINSFGYTVYTNTKNKYEAAIKGTFPVEIPLKYIPNFIQYAGSCISLRCGLTDLIAVSRCDVEVLYKIENEVDRVLAGVWTYKLGKENILYKRKWFIEGEADFNRFINYIGNKYGRKE